MSLLFDNILVCTLITLERNIHLATKQLLAQHGALKMLHGRLQLVVEYLKAVESGTLPRNEEVFRDVATLCHRLPVMDSERFKDEFQNVRIVSYFCE